MPKAQRRSGGVGSPGRFRVVAHVNTARIVFARALKVRPYVNSMPVQELLGGTADYPGSAAMALRPIVGSSQTSAPLDARRFGGSVTKIVLGEKFGRCVRQSPRIKGISGDKKFFHCSFLIKVNDFQI